MRDNYGKSFSLHTKLLFMLTFFSSTARFFVTYDIGLIIDSVSVGYHETLWRLWVIVALLLFSITASSLSVICSGRMTAKFACHLKTKIGERICMAEYQCIESLKDGELLTMATKDVDGLKSWLSTLLKIGCLPAQIGLAIIFVFRYNWKFSLFMFCLIPLAAIPEVLLSGRLHKYSTSEKNAYSKVLSFFTATIDSILLLKSFRLETLFQQKNQTILNTYKKEKMRYHFHEQLVEVYSRVFGHITNILILVTGTYFILNDEMTLGMLTSVILLANLVGDGLNILVQIPVCYQNAKASLSHLESLLLIAVEKENNNKNSAADQTGYTSVYEINSLNFSYGNRQVLYNISFRVNQGEKIAITGCNGCGKSTLFKILSGLYTPEKGHVLFHGKDIFELSPNYLRERITAVTQETFLFQATFYENICMTGRDRCDAAVIQAAKNAEIHDLIESSEQGYDTLINTTAHSLSNGQAQRINLARAFLRDTEVWLLDEPTSALDADTTKLVMDTLFSVCAERTILMILHNMREIPRFDKILVLENGKVEGFGPHEQLITECEAYRRLYSSEMTHKGD